MIEREHYTEWLARANSETVVELKAFENSDSEIRERFGRELAFGTGGLQCQRLDLSQAGAYSCAELNTPPGTVQADRANGALIPREWCMIN